MSSYNCQVCKLATHVILVAADDPETGQSWSDRLIPWRGFASALNLGIIAEVHSDPKSATDEVDGIGPDGVLRGRARSMDDTILAIILGNHLGTDKHPLVQRLAEYCIELATP